MITTVPFPGFYESWLSGGLDRVEEQYVEWVAEDHGYDVSTIQEVLTDYVDYKVAEEYLARKYAEEIAMYGLGEAYDDALDHALDHEGLMKRLEQTKEKV